MYIYGINLLTLSKLPMQKSPFKFLDSYTKEDRDIFFGRDREIEEMYQKVFESKILLVYGISGTGKTSLINCGLANKFEDSDWLPVTVRRGRNMLESLVGELQKHAISPPSSASWRALPPGGDMPARIVKTLKSIYLDHFKPIYLIFDQFEELFIFGDKNERGEFIQTVKKVVDSDVQCRFIFSIREEYLAGVTEFEQTIPDFLSNRMRIEKMTWSNAKKVIEEPCKVQGIRVEEGLTEKILGKLSPESTEVELTYLQVLLDKMYRIASRNAQHPKKEGEEQSVNGIGKEGDSKLHFVKSYLSEIGDVSDLLGSFLEEQISQLDNPETGLVILKSFVSAKGTKRQVILEEVIEFSKTLGKNISEEKSKELIIRFVKLRILRDRDENERYELRHDSLATKIFEKITLAEKELLEVRQFIENAFYSYQKRGILLSIEDLEYIATYERRMFLQGELSEFVNQSKHHLAARERAFRRILTYSAIGFLFIILVVIIYTVRSSGSLKSQKFVLASFLQHDFSPALSFESALEAYRKDTASTYAIKTLFDSFYALLEDGPFYDSLGNELNPGKALFDFTPCDSEIMDARFSDDGEYIYGYLADNSIRIWNRKGIELFSEKADNSSILSVKLAPDNSIITALSSDSTLHVWNRNGELICSIKAGYEPLNPHDVVSFSPKDGIFSCIGTDNQINIYDFTGKLLYELDGHCASVNAVDFSPNGRYIASGSKDTTIIIWKLDSITGRYQYAKQILNFQDVIWSVDFAENSRYILCTSTDTSSLDPCVCHLVRFNGEKRDIIYGFYDTAFLNKDTLLYDYRVTGKVVSARFAANDAAIIVTCLNEGIPPNDNNLHPGINQDFVRYRIRFSLNSNRKLMAENRVLRGYKWRTTFKRSKNVYYYSGIDFSKRECVAATISDRPQTILYHWDKLALATFKGTHPVFSPDGKYLLCIDNQTLYLYPSDEKEMIRLAEEELIFGKLESNIRDWTDFFDLKNTPY